MDTPHLSGKVTPPADMIEAASKSLSAIGFLYLMTKTGHKPPTPEQLVEAVEAERAAEASRNGIRI